MGGEKPAGTADHDSKSRIGEVGQDSFGTETGCGCTGRDPEGCVDAVRCVKIVRVIVANVGASITRMIWYQGTGL